MALFKKGQSGNPNGRPKKLKNELASIPTDAKEKIYKVLYRALTLDNRERAMEYMRDQDLGEYGFVFQLVCKELSGKNSWSAFNDILDRLFGKARQTAEVTHKGGTQIIVNAPDKDTAEEIEKL